MVEAKGTQAVIEKDANPNQVNSTAELREWCARQRKFLVSERDAAKTPDAKLIRLGMLRMLNNVESLLIQASTSFTKQPLPAAFPKTFDELSALLLDYYDLPRTFSITNLLNERWRFLAIKSHPDHKGPILTLNRYAREKDLMNAILQVLHDSFECDNAYPAIESNSEIPPPEPISGVIPLSPIKAVSAEEDKSESTEIEGGRGRREGNRFESRFTCQCGRTFKYEKAFKTHQELCPECKESGNGQRGRKQGDTFSAKFACGCGRTFKYEKAYLNHKTTCQG